MYLNAIERTGGSFAGEDAYLEGIPAIAGLGLLELHQPVTFLVGENGSGKSTLLEAVALALGFNPEGGSRGVLQKRDAFVGQVEEDHRRAEHSLLTQHIHVHQVADAHQHEDEHLPTDALEAHGAGQLLVHDGAHHAAAALWWT